MLQRAEAVEVEGGAVPVQVLAPEDTGAVPGLVVVPSIFGPAPDLLRRLTGLAGAALVVIPDPFWRVGGGVVPYGDHAGAIARLQGFDRRQCFADMRAVIEWARERCNGRVAGLGICFGGPYVLLAAGTGSLSGVVTWHGSRMEGFLDRADRITCPLRLHFGDADPITPPEAIDQIRAAFASHPDASFVIHPGAEHGFSHDGPAFDPIATRAALEDTRALLAGLASTSTLPLVREARAARPPAPPKSAAVFEPRSAETWRDPFPMYRALRDHDPVHHVEPDGGGGDYFVLSRFGHVLEAAVDAATYSSADGLTFTYGEKEKLGIEAPIVMMDPPEHTALRKLAIKRFTPQQVRALDPMIREFVVERVERLREMGEADVVAELLKPLPSLVVAHFLGVPREDRALFDRWTEAIVAANATGNVLGAADAVAEMFRYFSSLIEKRRRQPGEDMISALVHGRLGNGQEVSQAKILGMGFTMVTGGNDTTTGLLGGALELLTRHPDQRALLLEGRASTKNAVEEFLRLSSPVQGLARTTTRHVEVEGITIPKGRKVMLLYASANRDEREFGPDAAQCDVRRKIKRILSFSYGPHHCIGAAAARLQAQVALEELLARCPDFYVEADRGRYAPGHFVRRYQSLPFRATGAT